MIQLPIRKELFWDVDLARLDENTHARLIVERVLSYGTVREFRTLLSRYGKEKVAQLITRAGYLDKKTLAFASWYFRIPKEKFRCYKKRRSNPVHWS